MNGSLECEYRCFELFDGKNKDYKKALNEGKGEDEKRENASVYKRADGTKVVRKPNFKKDKMDRPERRFAAAHRDDDDDTFASHRHFSEDKRPGKMKYRDGGDPKRNFKKPFKRKGRDEYDY